MRLGSLLELDDDAARLLQTIPVRGSIPGGVPTDPTIYRFYEMVLGPSMTYTCACYPDPDVTLEEAQENKYRLVFGATSAILPAIGICLKISPAHGTFRAYANRFYRPRFCRARQH